MPAPSNHVLVIGGGVLGLTAAVRLLQCDPDTAVTVLDRGEVGGGASRYAGAIDIPYFLSESHRELVAFSWDWYGTYPPAAAHRLAVPISWCVENDAEGAELQGHVIEHLRDDDCRWPSPSNLLGQMRLSGSAFVIQSGPLCEALAAHIIQSGRARIVEHAAIDALRLENSAVLARSTEGALFVGSQAIVCIGPWLPNWIEPFASLARTKGVRNKSVFGVQVEVDLPQPVWHSIGWLPGGIFFLPYGRSGRYFMSIQHDVWNVVPEAPLPLLPEVEERVGCFLSSAFQPHGWRIAKASIFVDTYTNPYFPVVQRLPEFEGRVIVVTGSHGSGVRLAPALADKAASLCLVD
jgi:glycine/D-amino acid oxidase-like deaminating enzyme